MVLLDDQRRCVDANAAACRLLRMSRSEAVGRLADDLVPSDGRPGLEALWRAVLEHHFQTWEGELALLDGSRLRVHFSATVHIEPGVHLVMFLPDRPTDGGDVTQAHPPARALTPRERQIMGMLALGLTAEQIAEQLVLSPDTVRTHIRNARLKLGARNRAHAVALALKHDEISL